MQTKDGGIVFARYKPELRRPSTTEQIEDRARNASRLCAQRNRSVEVEILTYSLKEHVVRIMRRIASGQFEAAMAAAKRSLKALSRANREALDAV